MYESWISDHKVIEINSYNNSEIKKLHKAHRLFEKNE